MRRLLRTLVVVSVVHIVAFVVVVVTLDLGFSTTVQFIAPSSPEVVEMNRALWMEGEPVADIYGVATEQRAKIVFADEDRIVRPAEDSSLALYTVDKQAGENPLQVKTLWFILLRVVLLLVLVGALAAVALWRLGHRSVAPENF